MKRITNVRLLFCLIGMILLSTSVSAQLEKAKRTMTEKQYQETKSEANKGTPWGLPALPEKTTALNTATKKAPNVQKAPEDALSLFGHLIFRSSWTNGDAKYGIYSFPATADAPIAESYIDYEFGTNNGVYANGKYYFYKSYEYGGFIFSAKFYTYATNPWEQESVIECEPSFSSTPTSAITYDPVTDKIYAVTFNDDLTGYYFCEIDDLTEGTFKRLSTIEHMYAMAAHPNGLLYAIDEEGNLKSINKISGTVSLIGSTGLKPENAQSMVADWDSGKLYWAAFGEDLSGLYEVNIADGKANLISSFSEREEFVGLHIPDKISATNAPADIKEMTIALDGQTATVTLHVPTIRQDGEALNGKVTIRLRLDGQMVDEVSLQPGDSYEKKLNLSDGAHVMAAKAINESGESKEIYKQTYVGYDTPTEVSDLTLKVQGNNAELNWVAPSEGIHGGLYNPEEVSYRVTRYPGGVVVADNHKSTTYREQLPAELNKYYYEIVAISNGYSSKATTSNYYVAGEALTLPYEQTFGSREDLNLITLLDANNDKFCWRWKDLTMLYETNPDMDADDWIITPPLRMNANLDYLVSFDVHSASDGYPESVRLTLGTTTDNSTQKTILIDLPEVINGLYETQSVLFSVPQEGDYTIGINAYSVADSYNLYVKNLIIAPYAAKKGPKAVKDIKVTPADKGALSAKISFTAPTELRNDEPLTQLSKIEIYRGESKELIHTLTNCIPGAACEYIDDSASKGMNSYTVLAYNEFGSGEEISATAFIGVDIPAAPIEFIILSGVDNSATISWKAPEEGINGGYIDPASLKYTLYKYSDEQRKYLPIAEATQTTNTSFTDQVTVPAELQQVYAQYMVRAISAEGVSPDIYCGEMFGTPSELPFFESFVPKTFIYGSWAFITLEGHTYWKVGSHGMDPGASAYDGDNGILNYYSFEDMEAESRAISPKINLDSAESPVLKFMMYHTPALSKTNWVIPEVYKDGYYIATGDTIFANEGTGWQEHVVHLAAYKGKPVSISFRGHIDRLAPGFALDKVTIEHLFDHDLGILEFKTPAKLDINQPRNLEVSVYNFGAIKETNYQVKFYQDDILINTQDGLDIAFRDTLVYTFSVTSNPYQVGESHNFMAKVISADDMNENNNSVSTDIDFADPRYPVIGDLKGILQDGTSKFSWSAPKLTAIEKTDNFDYYEPFIIEDIGNWIVSDQDGQAVYTINNYIYPHIQEPNAYQVWNPSSIKMTADFWQPHSGKQCLVSFGGFGEMPDGEMVDPKSDDWLISPEVKGNTRLSFYANEPTDKYGDEKVEILVSSTDNRLESFTLLEKATITLGWKEYSYTLPENTKYFAIRHLVADVFALLIDDITYTPLENLSLNPLGYHVYRDGECITDKMITNTSFEDDFRKDAEYAVSVIYDRGESALSNKVKIVQSGIDTNNLSAEIYSQENKLILKNAINQTITVYQTNGCMVCKQFVDEAIKAIELPQGVYIVQLEDGKRVKVIIR